MFADKVALASVPTDLSAFLQWFRAQTERRWATYETFDFSSLVYGDPGGFDWQHGTHWTDGLTEEQIRGIEQRWQIQFPPDYRLFLRMLHTVDRPMIGRKYKTDKDGQEQLAYTQAPSFYNWLSDDESIDEYLNHRIREGLEFDIENADLWRPSWGAMPIELHARKKQMANALAQAPQLIPIYGHRYLLAEPCQSGNPIYSVVQADIIIYGDTLRDYLLYEFIDLLPLDRQEVKRYWYQQRQVREEFYQTVPFWNELAGL